MTLEMTCVIFIKQHGLKHQDRALNVTGFFLRYTPMFFYFYFYKIYYYGKTTSTSNRHWLLPMGFCCGITTLFQTCLPSRKGKNNKKCVVDKNEEDLRFTPEVGEEAKKIIDESPEICDEDSKEKTAYMEEPAQLSNEVKDDESEINLEMAKIHGGKESESVTQEKSEIDERSQNEIGECEEHSAAEEFYSQDEEYKWEISCCGVDIPLTK